MNNPLVIDVSDRSEVTFWCYVVEGDEVGVVAEFVDGDRPDPDDTWCRMTGEWIDDSNSGIGGGGVEVSDGVLAQNVGSVVATATGYYPVTFSEIPATMSKITVTFPREQNVSTEVEYSGGSGCELISSTVSVAVAALPLYPTQVDVPDDMELSDLVIVKSGATIDGTTDVTLYATSVARAYSMFYSEENYSKTTDDSGNDVLVATGSPEAYVVGAQFDDGQEIGEVSLSRYSASSGDKGTWSVGENNIGDNQSLEERAVTVSNSAGVKAYFTQGAGDWVNGAGIWGKITAVAGYGGEATLEDREEMSPARRIVVDCNCWAVDITVEVGYIDTSPDCWNGRDPEFCETPTVSVERVELCAEGSVCNDTGAEKVVVEGWNNGYSGERATIVAKANPDVEAPEETDADKLAALGGNTATPVAVEGGTMYPGTGGLYHYADNISGYKTFDRYQYGVLVGDNGVVPLPCELSGTGLNLSKHTTKVALVTEDTGGGIWLYEGWQAACFQEGISVAVSRVSSTLSILTITGEGNWTGSQRAFSVYVRPTEQDVWRAFTVVQDSPGSGLVLYRKGWDVDASSHTLSKSQMIGWYGFSSAANWTVEYMTADEVKEELGLDYDDEYGESIGVEFSTEDNGDGSGYINIDSIKISANSDTTLQKCWYFRVSCDETPSFGGENVCYFYIEQAPNYIEYWTTWKVADSYKGGSVEVNTHIGENNDETEYTSSSFEIEVTGYSKQSAHPDETETLGTVNYMVPAVIYPERTIWYGGVTIGGALLSLSFIREASNYSVGSTEVTESLADEPEIENANTSGTTGTLPAGSQWHEHGPKCQAVLTATGWFLHHYYYGDGSDGHPRDVSGYVGEPYVRWRVSGETYSGETIDVPSVTDTALRNTGISLVENGSNSVEGETDPYPLEFSTTLGLPLYEEYCDTETRTGAWAEFSTTLGEFTGGILSEGFLSKNSSDDWDYSDQGPGGLALWPSGEAVPDYVYSPIKVTYTWAPSWYLRLENETIYVPSAGGTVTNPVLRDWKPNYPDDETVVTDVYWTVSCTIEPNTDEETKTFTRWYSGNDYGRTQDLSFTIVQAGAGVVYSLESSTGEIDQWGGEVEFTIVATSDATGEVIETLTRTATIDANPTLSARTVTGTITAPDGTELEYSVEQAAATGYLDLAENTFTIGAEGGTIKMTLQVVAETTGDVIIENYYSKNITVGANESLEERTITGRCVILSHAGKVPPYSYRNNTYTIIQSGATVTYTITDGEGRTIGALGGTLEFTVEGVNDITGEVISTETYTVTIAENTSEESRTVTGTITVGDTALTWSVEQPGAGSAWLTATPDYVFLEKPVAADIEIAVATENIEMDNITTSLTDAAGEAVDWLAESSRTDNGGGEFAFTFSVSENTGAHARSATVTLTDAGSGESVEISVLQAPTKTSMRIYIGRERFRGAIYLGRKRLKVF